jgi:hypothetical protein
MSETLLTLEFTEQGEEGLAHVVISWYGCDVCKALEGRSHGESDAVVGDGNPLEVAGEVHEDCFRPLNRGFAVDDPRGVPQEYASLSQDAKTKGAARYGCPDLKLPRSGLLQQVKRSAPEIEVKFQKKTYTFRAELKPISRFTQWFGMRELVETQLYLPKEEKKYSSADLIYSHLAATNRGGAPKPCRAGR